MNAGLKITGNLGKTMLESCDIAYSYAKGFIARKYHEHPNWFKAKKIDPFVLNKKKVHLHVPEGATPKDGPSAGITITSAIISLALDIPLTRDLGMTGEISLMGHVMQIGGLKEKLIASRREGLQKILCPLSNEND